MVICCGFYLVTNVHNIVSPFGLKCLLNALNVTVNGLVKYRIWLFKTNIVTDSQPTNHLLTLLTQLPSSVYIK